MSAGWLYCVWAHGPKLGSVTLFTNTNWSSLTPFLKSSHTAMFRKPVSPKAFFSISLIWPRGPQANRLPCSLLQKSRGLKWFCRETLSGHSDPVGRAADVKWGSLGRFSGGTGLSAMFWRWYVSWLGGQRQTKPQREQDGARFEHEKGGAKVVLVMNMIIHVFRIWVPASIPKLFVLLTHIRRTPRAFITVFSGSRLMELEQKGPLDFWWNPNLLDMDKNLKSWSFRLKKYTHTHTHTHTHTYTYCLALNIKSQSLESWSFKRQDDTIYFPL